jgi:hypothetical protein
MDALLKTPGKARRKTVDAELVIPSDSLPLANASGPPTGIDPANLDGIVVDDTKAERSGDWTAGTGLKGYVGWSYLYAANNSGATIRFDLAAPEAAKYELRLAYLPHENRGTQVPVTVQIAGGSPQSHTIDMTKAPTIDGGFISLGQFELGKTDKVSVTISADNAGGNVHADAVQLLRVAP